MAKGDRYRIWDNFKTIGEIRKSERIMTRFSIGARDGIKYLHIREFVLKGKTINEWIPTWNGISVPIKMPRLGDTPDEVVAAYIDMMQKVCDAHDDFPIYDEEHTIWGLKKR